MTTFIWCFLQFAFHSPVHHTHKHTHRAPCKGSGLNIKSNLGFSVLDKGTSTCGQEDWIAYPVMWGQPLYLLSRSHPSVKCFCAFGRSIGTDGAVRWQAQSTQIDCPLEWRRWLQQQVKLACWAHSAQRHAQTHKRCTRTFVTPCMRACEGVVIS